MSADVLDRVEQEHGHWKAHALVRKWDAPHTIKLVEEARLDLGLVVIEGAQILALGIEPDSVEDRPDNILLTAGITRMLNLLIGAGGAAFTNGVARLGVGNGSTAVTAGDTDLSASAGTANRLYHTMDATFPSVSSNVVTFQATFGGTDGNFAWNEWGIDAGGGGGNTATVTAPLLNRRVPSPSLGTKTGGTWTLTTTITIT